MAHSCDDYFTLCICTVGETVELSHVLSSCLSHPSVPELSFSVEELNPFSI